MPIFDQAFDDFKRSRQLIDVYRERLDRQPLTGWVIDASLGFVYLSRLNEDGEPDGISIVRRDDITRVRWNGRELDSLQRLSDARSLVAVCPELDLDSIQGAIRTVQEQFEHVGLMIEGVDPAPVFIGTLDSMDEEHVVLDTFGALGRLDRSRMMFWLEDVTRIDAGGKYESGLVYLHQLDDDTTRKDG